MLDLIKLEEVRRSQTDDLSSPCLPLTALRAVKYDWRELADPGTLNPSTVFNSPLGRCLQSEMIETIPIEPVPLWRKFHVKKKKAKVPI